MAGSEQTSRDEVAASSGVHGAAGLHRDAFSAPNDCDPSSSDRCQDFAEVESELEEIYVDCVSIVEGPLKELKHLSKGVGMNIRFYTSFRDVATHIARALCALTGDYVPDGAEADSPAAYALQQLKLAKSHLRGCELDCYKAGCICYDVWIENAIDALGFACPLRLVHDGEYLTDLRSGQAAARKLHIEAKEVNARQGRVALPYFKKAMERYRALYRMIKEPDPATRQRINELIERKRLKELQGMAKTAAKVAWTTLTSTGPLS